MRAASAPPRMARWLLERALPLDVRDDVSGDLEEVFARRTERDGALRARLWYWREAVAFATRFGRERVREVSAGEAGVPRGASTGARAGGGGVSWLDIKLGVRILGKYPGLTFISALGIALAVALATSWFAFSEEMVHPRIPLDEGDRIVRLQTVDANTLAPERRQLHDFELWRRELRSVVDLTAGTSVQLRVAGGERRPEAVQAVHVTPSMFRLARVAPLLGRPLLEADDEPTAPPVVVIGYDVWRRMFDGDVGIIGRTVRVGSSQRTVVGVMPEGYAFPANHELWLPLRERAVNYARRAGPGITVLARLGEGRTMAEAQAELTALGARVATQFPDTHERLRPQIGPMVEFGDESVIARAANLAFILLLAVVCANVATLVFARTVTREGEIALRTAIGASRKRIVLQLTTEAFVLASIAAAVGLGIAKVGLDRGMDLFWEVQQTKPPFWFDASVDPKAVAYVALLTVLGSAIVGVIPALKTTGNRIQPHLTLLAAGGSRLRFGAGSTFIVVAQVAICVALLPFAIFIAREMRPQAEVADGGIPVDAFLSARLARESDAAALTDEERAAYLRETASLQDEMLDRFAAEPGIAALTFADRVPGMNHPAERIIFDGPVPAPDSVIEQTVRTLGVDPNFFGVMNARVLAGRALREADLDSDAPVVVVGQAFARDFLGGLNTVGRRIRYPDRGEDDAERWHEIVGVVEDPAIVTYGAGSYVGIYRPLGPGAAPALTVLARPTTHTDIAAGRLYDLAETVDPSLVVDEVMTLGEVWAPVRRSDRFFTAAIAAVSGIALLFSLAGIYALMTFTVAQRAREIAIRAALGARPRRIVLAIFSRALLQIGLGVVLGATLVSLTAVDTPGGAGIVAAVAALMMGVGVAACAVPAVRALRIHPAEAFRES